MHPTPKQLDMSERSQMNLFFYAPQSNIHTTTSHLGCCRSPRWAVTPPDLWAYEAITTSKAQSLPNSVMPPLGLQARVTETKLTIKLFPTQKNKKNYQNIIWKKEKEKKSEKSARRTILLQKKKRKKSSGPDFRPDGQGLTDQFRNSLGSFLSHSATIIFIYFYTKALSSILNLESSSSKEQFLFLSVAFCLRRCRNGEEVRERERASLAVRRAGCAIGVHCRLRRSAASGRSPLLRSPLRSHLRHRRRA